MTDTIRVKGLSDLQRLLDQLPAKIERNVLRGALRAGAKPILADAKNGAPVDEGILRDGLKISTSAKGSEITASIKARGPHGFLGQFYEFGTVRQGSRPFMRPALDRQSSAAVVASGQYIKKRLSSKHGMDTADITIEDDQ